MFKSVGPLEDVEDTTFGITRRQTPSTNSVALQTVGELKGQQTTERKRARTPTGANGRNRVIFKRIVCK